MILSVPHPGQSNHNGGWIGFGPDGLLYVATGDGGGGRRSAQQRPEPQQPARQDAAHRRRGRRLPRRSRLRDYAIPAGNPFAASGGAPEIWAFGLRNPYRNSFDPLTQALWIGDVGQDAREEIDLMRPTDGGANFGWNVVEGTANFTGPPQAGFTPPVAEYLHGTGKREGNSVTGGYVYRGPVEALRGQYFFADFVRPNIWSFPIARLSIGTTLASSQFTLRNADFAPNAGAFNNISSFGVDQAGNLYIVDYDGEIFRIEGDLEPLGGRDHVGRAQRREDPHQMRQIVHLHVEMEGVEAAVARGLVHADDIGAVAAEDARDHRQRARLVLDDDGEPGGAAVALVAPGEIDPVGIDAARQAVAADRVDLDPLALRGAGRRCGRRGSGGSIRRAGRPRRASGP